MLTSLYLRADVRGLHHVPRDGPVLLVGNHSGSCFSGRRLGTWRDATTR